MTEDLPSTMPTPLGPGPTDALKAAAWGEIAVMLRYAWSRGIELAPDVRDRLDALDAPGGDAAALAAAPLVVLAAIHADLARAVAPAMPITLCIMDGHRGPTASHTAMGSIGNVRRLLAAAFAFLAAFIGISMCSDLTANTLDGDIYTLDGARQIVVMAFLLSAAGIGGTFQALFTAQRYVADASYDPRFDGSYWILIALGLVAGLLLSVLVPVSMESAESPTLAKPVLALLGGFSSGLVYRILQRLVDTIESLFQPSK